MTITYKQFYIVDVVDTRSCFNVPLSTLCYLSLSNFKYQSTYTNFYAIVWTVGVILPHPSIFEFEVVKLGFNVVVRLITYNLKWSIISGWHLDQIYIYRKYTISTATLFSFSRRYKSLQFGGDA